MTSRKRELKTGRNPDGPDLASAVEHVMFATYLEVGLDPSMTLREVDEILDRLGAASPFSSIDLWGRIEARHSRLLQVDEMFSAIFCRQYSSEASWIVRMLFKTYSPVLISEIATVSKEKIGFTTAKSLESGTRIVAPTATFTLEEEKQII
jgi:hypothetical protein